MGYLEDEALFDFSEEDALEEKKRNRRSSKRSLSDELPDLSSKSTYVKSVKGSTMGDIVEDEDDELPELDYSYDHDLASAGPEFIESDDDGSYLFPRDVDESEESVYEANRLMLNLEDTRTASVQVVEREEVELVEEGISLASLSSSFEQIENLVNGNPDEDDEEARRKSFDHTSFAYTEDDDDDELLGFRLDDVIARAIELKASDIHISPDDQVAFTILDEIYRAKEFGIIFPEVTRNLQLKIISHVLEAYFIENLELDASYVVKTGPAAGRRLRLSVGKSFGGIFMVFRVIADVIPTPEQLGIESRLLDWCKLPNGLVLMNGSTGTGKSTTLASLVRQCQLTRRQKIITIERPIEYVFGTEGLALVTQREVGLDARRFDTALTSALRQAPHIIMIGETRNREEVDELLRAAETGHLAISTMHTFSTPGAITRIMGLYKDAGDDQSRILATLSEVLRGVANQVLVKTPDGSSRFAVREILEVDEEISDYILKGDVRSIQEFQKRNGTTMNHELSRAVIAGHCTFDEAKMQASNPIIFDKVFKELS